MPLSESIAYQEQALLEAGDDGDVTTAAHAVLARLRGNGGDYRAALTHAERAGAGAEASRANLMFPSTGRRARHRPVLRRRGARRGALPRRDRARGVDRPQAASRTRARGSSSRSPLLYTGQLADARRLLLELLELSIELGRSARPQAALLHLTELELRAGDGSPGGGARTRVPPSRRPAPRRPRRRVVPERHRRRPPRSGGGRATDPARGSRRSARRRVADLAGAPSRGARPRSSSRSVTSARRTPRSASSPRCCGRRGSASGRCIPFTPMRSRRSWGSARSRRP